MKLTNKIKLLSSLCAATLLAACGDSTTVNTETGTFMKGQASGVIYTTETHTGVTDENGAYQYEPGENISFYIGGTQLGATVPAGAAVGPMDLVSGVTIPTGAKEVRQFLNNEGMTFGEDATLDLRYELMNILMFLYSADKDKDTSNGIMIDAGLHVTLASNNYDLKIRASRFDDIEGLERQFYMAYNSGAVDSARLIRRWKALDDFASLEGLAPEVMAQATYSMDEDADGTIDYTDVISFDSRMLFSGVSFEGGSYQVEYNDYGDSLSNSYTEMHEEGVDTNTGATTRDIHGNRLTTTETHNGEVVYSTLTTYDSFGERTSESYDQDGDGTFDEIYTYTRDDMGNRTSESYDDGGDGTIDEIYTYTYDAEGNLTFEAEDYDGDGVYDETYSYTYDANGNQVEYAYDEDGDGTIDEISTSTYDADGNQLSHTDDYDADGVADRVYTYTYDANGNQLTYSRDNDADGVADSVYTYTYDANDNQLSDIRDYNGDGTPDRIYLYQYNAASQQTFYSQDNDGDGVPNYIRTYTYDANGNRTQQAYDTNGDGTINRVYNYEYDADNNQTRNEYDHDADGTPSWVYLYEYDENGNQILESNDNNGDGTIDRISTRTYQLINFLGWYTWD